MLINQILYFNFAIKHLEDFEIKTIHNILECKVSMKETRKNIRTVAHKSLDIRINFIEWSCKKN